MYVWYTSGVSVNPFRPGFGRLPTLIVGRDSILAPFPTLFTSGGGKQWATHLEAHRGAGKTVVLDAIQDCATDAGWIVVQEDAGSTHTGLIRRLTDRVLAVRDEITPHPTRRLAGGGATVLGVGANLQFTDHAPSPAVTLRDALDSLLDLDVNGVLLTVDEIHDAMSPELKELGNAAQHMQRNGRRFAIVVAGLPTGADRGPTFLARCDRPPIGALSDDDTRIGLTETARLGEVLVEDRAMLQLVSACQGNPYMLQLVGYYSFERAHDGVVRLADAVAAVGEATGEIIDSITRRVAEDLPRRERDFLIGMSRSGSPARIADVREHLNVSSQYVNVYRTRLIKSGLIRSVGYGLVDFALPGLVDMLA